MGEQGLNSTELCFKFVVDLAFSKFSMKIRQSCVNIVFSNFVRRVRTTIAIIVLWASRVIFSVQHPENYYFLDCSAKHKLNALIINNQLTPVY